MQTCGARASDRETRHGTWHQPLISSVTALTAPMTRCQDAMPINLLPLRERPAVDPCVPDEVVLLREVRSSPPGARQSPLLLSV
ncbi:hypothetical protein NDU88_004516 [Pleurodeles waltl]|uniref:Uncharacterized protein n=1 Tax=Pleurodeles waltl TaxID=8319 RepID=A0AAV7TUH9_PLEWA|nr:hypothetical protein NDU88_004516 [Pleurodeles waltl]